MIIKTKEILIEKRICLSSGMKPKDAPNSYPSVNDLGLRLGAYTGLELGL